VRGDNKIGIAIIIIGVIIIGVIIIEEIEQQQQAKKDYI